MVQESEILAAIRAGDTEQFGILYDAYAERIYKYHFYRIRERDTAEDLTSATFFKAIQHVAKFDTSKGTFSAWIYRIARNTLFDHLRAMRRTEPIEAIEDVPAHADLERETIDRELVRKVKDSFSSLSEEQREIIKMRVWDDLPYSEIAKILGKSEGSCKMAFYRGIDKLKNVAPLAIIILIIKSIALQ